MRTYTDADRVHALATLEVNAGNATKTARSLGIPKPTLLAWRNAAIEAGSEQNLTPTDPVKTDFGALFSEALQEAVRYLRAELPQLKGRDLAITTGILADKTLDFTQGRKTSSVNVDARSVNLTQLTDQQLARLADGR